MDSLHPLSIESLTSPRKMSRLSVSDFPLSPGPLSAFFPMFPGSDPLSLAIQQLSPLGANLNGSTGSSLNSSGSSYSSEGLQSLSLDSVQPVSPPDSLSSCSRASQNTSTPRIPSVTPSPPPTSASEAEEASPRSDSSSRRDESQPSSPETHTAKVLEKLDKCAASVAPGKSSTPDPKGKPAHSYISLISMAILSSPDKKMILCDIYQWIMDNFEYYNNEERAWRNSIRHNLSLNECFIKAGRAENGKGNYWAIHPSCVQDFSKGDYRRRHARRRARNTRSHFNVSSMPYNYRCNLGYVPMTSNAVGYHPYANPMQFLPSATASYPPCAMATPATSSGQTASSLTHPAFYQAAQMVHRGQTRGQHPMAFSGHPAGGNTSNMMLGHHAGHGQPSTAALPQPQFHGLNHVAPHTQYTSQGFPALW